MGRKTKRKYGRDKEHISSCDETSENETYTQDAKEDYDITRAYNLYKDISSILEEHSIPILQKMTFDDFYQFILYTGQNYL